MESYVEHENLLGASAKRSLMARLAISLVDRRGRLAYVHPLDSPSPFFEQSQAA